MLEFCGCMREFSRIHDNDESGKNKTHGNKMDVLWLFVELFVEFY
jgi:hypothetical protein